MLLYIFLILLGFSSAVVASFMGIGGALILLPALNIMGVKIIYAIGTIFFFRLTNGVISSYNHFKLNNINYKLSGIFSVGFIIGITITKYILFYLNENNLADKYVRIAFIVFMLIMGSIMIFESLFTFKKRNKKGNDKIKNNFILTKIKIPPYVYIKEIDSKISFFIFFIITVICGFIAGFLGIGGGLLVLPVLVYFIGIPTSVAAGSSVLTVLISSLWGAILYGSSGAVKIDYVIFLTIGALAGSRFGARATKKVNDYIIRFIIGCTVFIIGFSIFFKQLNYTNIAGLILGIVVVIDMILILYFNFKKGELIN